MGQLCMLGDGASKGVGLRGRVPAGSSHTPCLLAMPTWYLTCKAYGALESTTHALEAVFNEVAEELGWGVEHLVAQLTLMVNAFLCK